MPRRGAFAVNQRRGFSPCSQRADVQHRLCDVEFMLLVCAKLLTPNLPDMPDMRLHAKDLRMSAE